MTCQQIEISGSSGRLICLFFANELVYGAQPENSSKPDRLYSSSDAFRWLGDSACMVRYRQIAQLKEREGDLGIEISHGSSNHLKQTRLETFTQEQHEQLFALLQQYLGGTLVNSSKPRAWWHAALNPVLAIIVSVLAGYQVIVPLFWPTLMLVALAVMLSLVTLRLNLAQPMGTRIWKIQRRWWQPFRTGSFIVLSLLVWSCILTLISQRVDHYYGDDAIFHAYHEGRLFEWDLQRLRLHGVSLDRKDRYGYTVLMYATEADDVSLVGILLRSGASPDVIDNQRQTALFHAIGSQSRPLLNLLASHCAINHRDAYGATPVMYLLEHNPSAASLAILIRHGADLNLVNQAGDSVLAQALQLGVKEEVAKTLITHGAKLTQEEMGAAEYQQAIRHYTSTDTAHLLIQSVL
ncbi:hypothetical protein DU002_16940 [Corallincola holothuriorum]|uniref:Uncharacterized protein n=1 Tax=Corallincola holothuriorum TaxID=2282215 RepID=A0A368N6D2_9GAMM|nr:ankyrin repeat domain-containing protein [Corallincola holothuriorum]RCU45114.1 hypothetical protein DU002_16940 [Corallincola holothuriorum]